MSNRRQAAYRNHNRRSTSREAASGDQHERFPAWWFRYAPTLYSTTEHYAARFTQVILFAASNRGAHLPHARGRAGCRYR